MIPPGLERLTGGAYWRCRRSERVGEQTGAALEAARRASKAYNLRTSVVCCVLYAYIAAGPLALTVIIYIYLGHGASTPVGLWAVGRAEWGE